MSLWDKMFGKDPKDLFLSFDPQDSHWSMVTWNFDLAQAVERQWSIEVHKDAKQTEIIHWKKQSDETLSFYKNSNLIRKRKITPLQEDLKSLMNLALHSTLKTSLEKHQHFMITPVSGATTSDLQNEFRALQWVQASFGMVTRALDNMKDKKDLIMTGAFFSGIEPETQDTVLRVIIFNLDIFFYMTPDQSLRVVIFDDKNMGHGESRNPTFQQIIKVTKPQFYDEIVKLVHRIASHGEIF